MPTKWLKQSKDSPLFPDILWSRPENKRSRGKLLIIGGNLHSFTAVSQAYQAALLSGAGAIRVLLPDVLRKSLTSIFPEAIFCPSTPSGSFSKLSIDDFCASADWADAVILTGDFGKNSETAIALESFVKKYAGLLTLAGDSLDYFFKNYQLLLDRPSTLIIGDIMKLQKVLAGRIFIRHSVELPQLAELLSEAAQGSQMMFVTKYKNQIVASASGQVSVTENDQNLPELGVAATVFWLQNPRKPFEAISASATL